MPITISYQNNANNLNVAYRPIVYRCKANISGATLSQYIPPVVYCDVYVNGIYYKTLSKTQFIDDDGVAPEYEFDIQDAIQEVMSFNLPPLDDSNILEFTNTLKKVYVKFRNAKYDSNGFIVSEQLEPIQATNSNEAVPGEGIQSNEIYVVNGTIQHEEYQSFKIVAENFKTGEWNVSTFPLTKRPKKIKLCKKDSSFFPITTESEIICLELNYKLKGQNNTQIENYCYPVPPANTITITNIETVGNTNNRLIYFTANFPLTQLICELSGDTVNIDSNLPLSGIASPQNKVIGTTYLYRYVRITDINPNGNTASQWYYFETSIPTAVVTIPTSQSFSFSKTQAQVNNQSTAFETLTEAVIFNSYTNSENLNYASIKIISLPNRGSLTVNGTDITTPFICSLAQIQQGLLDFWATGSDGSQPFSSFNTSFQYLVIDENGNESNITTFNIQFNAI